MRKLFRFQLKNRNNSIILRYQDNLQRFTFLQTNCQNNIKYRHISLSNQHNSSMTDTTPKNNFKFIQSFNKNKMAINKIQQYDFNAQQLMAIKSGQFLKMENKNENNSKKLWIQNQKLISQLSTQFHDLIKISIENISEQTLPQTIRLLTQINCIDLKIWQKIFCYIQTHYKAYNLNDRLLMINSLSEYLKKFIPSYDFNRLGTFKFMYPQNYINDLIDFRTFFKRTQTQLDFVQQRDSHEIEQQKLQLLQNKIFLLIKATKKADVNVYSLRQYFSKRMSQMIRISNNYTKSPLHQRLLYNIYFIYSYLNEQNLQFYQSIQKNYYQYLRRKFSKNNSQQLNYMQISNRSKQINRLLSIWKLNMRTSMDVYRQIIRPFLIFIIQNKKQVNFYSTIAMNLVMSGIQDHQILDQFVRKCDQFKIRQDQMLHMLKHYLNIIKNGSHYQTNFNNCHNFQNHHVLKYIRSNQDKIYASCLQLNQSVVTKSSIKKGTQYHKSQKIWSKIIKKIFQPNSKVLQGVHVCNYQIDFLILTKNGMIAIQIQGGHYNKKHFNKDVVKEVQVQYIGKKNMREVILKSYGIRILRVHCQQKIPIYIMQSRNIQLGSQFLKTKIEEAFSIDISNL